MPPTDRELWERARSGDAPAFGALFERHARAVYNYCFRRTADWAAAEDLTSIVFLDAWRKRDTVRLAADEALPWLLGVATNVLRNRWRSERRYRAALARLPVERGPDFADEADARLDDERRMRATLRSLSGLRRDERDVFALCAWEGLSYEEAAVALGIPCGTVRSRLSRARTRLREQEAVGGPEPEIDAPVPANEGL